MVAFPQCRVRFARQNDPIVAATGAANFRVARDAQTHSHHRHQNRLGCDCLSGARRVSIRSQARPVFDLFAPAHPRQTTPAMELHDSTQSVKLFLRLRLAPHWKFGVTSPCICTDLEIRAVSPDGRAAKLTQFSE
jgi:hypothetical protein